MATWCSASAPSPRASGTEESCPRHRRLVARRSLPPPAKQQLASYSSLTTWCYSDAPTTVRPKLDAARRVSTFDEVVGDLEESTALFEARRCLSCGNCFACDNCYGVCPDNAVIKLGVGGPYAIDYAYCKG